MARMMQEYVIDADYAHIHEFADTDENLIHNIHVELFAKRLHFFGPEVGQLIIIVHSFLILSIFRNTSPE